MTDRPPSLTPRDALTRRAASLCARLRWAQTDRERTEIRRALTLTRRAIAVMDAPPPPPLWSWPTRSTLPDPTDAPPIPARWLPTPTPTLSPSPRYVGARVRLTTRHTPSRIRVRI